MSDTVQGRSPYALYDAEAPTGAPSLDIDPFSLDVLDDPYPAHALLRDAGPLVWLPQYGIGAVARYAEVRQALLDWESFSSARGVGMEDFVRHGRFRLPSLILEADPPQHTRSRAVLNKALSPAVMRGLRERFASTAEAMVERLVDQGSFDAIQDLAVAYPLEVFPDAIGMSRDGREWLLPHADLLFNSFGPRNMLFTRSLTGARFDWVEQQGRRENLLPGGIGMSIHAAVDAGEITADEASKLVRALLQAGLDTTVNALGAALYCLARFPDQWAKLRANPSLARLAFDEATRFESPVQTFFRTVARPATLGGSALREGDKILMFLGAANRDPRQWERPDDYDIERRALGHVGFGAGIHLCVGQLLARLEGEAVLSALAAKAAKLEICGPARRRHNNTLRGLASLPLAVRR
jgi:cytochrome P450